MNYTLNAYHRRKIANFLSTHDLPSGLGDREMACSIASINLALTNTLSDDIPECMSRVLGSWIIQTQDAMSDELRNSEEWKYLLPFAAGTGRDHELAREEMIREWHKAIENYQCDGDCDGGDYGSCECNIVDRCDPVAFLRRLIEVSHIIPAKRARRERVLPPCPACMA